MRRGVVTVIVLTALAAAVMPALAADETTITASDFRFTPSQVTIRAGDTVRFANSGGTHNFAFADGASYPPSPSEPGAAWNNLSRTFTQAGAYAFVCDEHPNMTGTVTVLAASATPTPTATPRRPAPARPPRAARSSRSGPCA